MNQKNNGISVIFEGLWLVIALTTIAMGIHATIHHGFKNSYTFFIITVIAVLLFYTRRSLRLKNNDK